MKFGNIVQRAGKIASQNSPAILTGLAAAGVLATAYLSGTASVEASRVIEDRERELGESLDTKSRIDLTWRLYIPSAGMATLTIGSIFFANRISNRRVVLMASAYTIAEKTLVEYQDKVRETIGSKREQGIREKISQDRVDRNPEVSSQVIILPSGNHLCYEAYTGRYFTSSWETLREAQNDFNKAVLSQGYSSLSEFYDIIGLEHTQVSEEIGWTSDKLLELMLDSTLSGDKKPCISVGYNPLPKPYFFRGYQ